MPGLHIGKLAPDAVVKDEEIKKDFIELRKTAEQMVHGSYRFSTNLCVWYFGYTLQALAVSLLLRVCELLVHFSLVVESLLSSNASCQKCSSSADTLFTCLTGDPIRGCTA